MGQQVCIDIKWKGKQITILQYSAYGGKSSNLNKNIDRIFHKLVSYLESCFVVPCEKALESARQSKI